MYHSSAAPSQKDDAAKAATQKDSIAKKKATSKNKTVVVNLSAKLNKTTRSTIASKKRRTNNDYKGNESKLSRVPTVINDDLTPLSQMSDLSQSQVRSPYYNSLCSVSMSIIFIQIVLIIDHCSWHQDLADFSNNNLSSDDIPLSQLFASSKSQVRSYNSLCSVIIFFQIVHIID